MSKRRKPRMVTCPDCDGGMHMVDVVGRSLDGTAMPGIELRHVVCNTCDSTGKVKPTRTAACCCSQGGDKCANCATNPSGIHVCLVPSADDLDAEIGIAMADRPRTGTKLAYTSKAAMLESFSTMRSGDRD